MPEDIKVLYKKLNKDGYEKLSRIRHPGVLEFILDADRLCKPDEIFICSDHSDDIAYIRSQAILSGEEKPLKISGHTYHFDGIYDQGRDRKNTRFLVPKGDSLNPNINQIERDKGLEEVRELLKDSMKNRVMIIRFLTLGPPNSIFSLPCIECTDSWYVAHSVSLLYRPGYEAFCNLDHKIGVFYTLHSSGKLDENKVSKEYEKRRIYIDYSKDTVYSVNTQYAGNSVGFKKLALRLAIRKAHREGWLAEHFMIVGIKGDGGRKTYIAGAFPSACGKTSTAMLPGETILADDISYVRNINGVCRAVNVESGIFGIIQNVNPQDDPLIYKALTSPKEIIFSNCLVNDGRPFWLGMGSEIPEEGINYSGKWFKGKTDSNGNEILPSHKNSRYAISLKAMDNCDPELDNPEGVELRGIMFGGRDYKGYVPVQEGFGWSHGIIAYGAALETVTTFATVEEEGKYEINIMSIQDFVSIPLGEYLKNYLKFGKRLSRVPQVFGVNYFLKDLKKDKFLNDRKDKHIWVKWMELRIHRDVEAIKTPTGMIPKYTDLQRLFKQILGKHYCKEEYIAQFSTRVVENLEKIDRVIEFYKKNVDDAPGKLFDILKRQKERLISVRERFGDYISPYAFEENDIIKLEDADYE